MRENSVCDLVQCIHWDAFTNANESISITELRRECKDCKHSKNNNEAGNCNFILKE